MPIHQEAWEILVDLFLAQGMIELFYSNGLCSFSTPSLLDSEGLPCLGNSEYWYVEL